MYNLCVSVHLAGIRLGWTRPTIQTIDFCNNIHLHMRYTAQHLKQHKLQNVYLQYKHHISQITHFSHISPVSPLSPLSPLSNISHIQYSQVQPSRAQKSPLQPMIKATHFPNVHGRVLCYKKIKFCGNYS